MATSKRTLGSGGVAAECWMCSAFPKCPALEFVCRLQDVKSTDYFRNVVPRKHPEVRLEWVQRVLANPVKRAIQADGRFIYWGTLLNRMDGY